MQAYLNSSDLIDWRHPDVLEKATYLAKGITDKSDIVETCYVWVRDNIRHTADYHDNVITCRASDVLREGTGYCFSKSHLLAALLRANGIPTGLCYQRLSRNDNGAPFCLHGLNAVHLPDHGWYRVDPRGNKLGITAQYTPPVETLAFALSVPGEADLPEIWPEPLPIVVEMLQNYQTHKEAWANLPDVELLTL